MKRQEILFITFSFFGLVVLYFAFTFYHQSVTSTIPEDLNIQILPISPTFDEKTISDIKNRNSISPVYNSSQIQNETVKIATNEATTSAKP